MATNETLIPIPGRLHSVASEGHVSGADEIYDDSLQKTQATINQEVQQSLGTGGSVDSKIAAAVNVEKERAQTAESALSGNITAEQTRAEAAEGALDTRIDTLEDAVGTGGSVDSRIFSAVSAEASRAQTAEADRYTKSETYTKEEVHNLITTPNQKYASVTATAQTTAVTDVLPATGAADTTYRVGNWDGTQYNDSVFSEYAWNGSAYIKLSTKSQVGEVYDISANHADTKYADLTAALGTNGENIPQSLQKGGMSIKFVQSSDNKYVQARCMAQNFTTDVTQWQGVDDEPVAGSQNLVKSGGVFNAIENTNERAGVVVTNLVLTTSNTRVAYDWLKAGNRLEIKIAGLLENQYVIFTTIPATETTKIETILNTTQDGTYYKALTQDAQRIQYYVYGAGSTPDVSCEIRVEGVAEEYILNRTVRYDQSQNLASSQKAQARNNIGAADIETVEPINRDLGNINFENSANARQVNVIHDFQSGDILYLEILQNIDYVGNMFIYGIKNDDSYTTLLQMPNGVNSATVTLDNNYKAIRFYRYTLLTTTLSARVTYKGIKQRLDELQDTVENVEQYTQHISNTFEVAQGRIGFTSLKDSVSDYYVGYQTIDSPCRVNVEECDNEDVVAVNHDDCGFFDLFATRRIYNKYGFRPNFNFILSPMRISQFAAKKEGMTKIVRDGHHLGLHAIMSMSHWFYNKMFDIRPDGGFSFALQLSNLRGNNADGTGVNSFGDTITATTTLADMKFLNISEVSAKIVELTESSYRDIIAQYCVYYNKDDRSGLLIGGTEEVTHTSLWWIEYYYNTLIDSTLGYSSEETSYVDMLAEDYEIPSDQSLSSYYPDATHIKNGKMVFFDDTTNAHYNDPDYKKVGRFRKGIFKGAATCCNYEVIIRLIQVAEAYCRHYFGMSYFDNFGRHGEHFVAKFFTDSNGIKFDDYDKTIPAYEEVKLYCSIYAKFMSQHDMLLANRIKNTNYTYSLFPPFAGQYRLFKGRRNIVGSYFNNADYINFLQTLTSSLSIGQDTITYQTFMQYAPKTDWIKWAYENAGLDISGNGTMYMSNDIRNVIDLIQECRGTGKIPFISLDTIRTSASIAAAIEILCQYCYLNNIKIVGVEEARKIACKERIIRPNMFVNPEFTQSLLDTFNGSSTVKGAYLPDGWRRSTVSADFNFNVYDATVNDISCKVFKIENDTESEQNVTTKIWGLPGGKYKFSAWVKTTNTTSKPCAFGITLCGDFVDVESYIERFNASSEFTLIEYEFSINEPCKNPSDGTVQNTLCKGYEDNVVYIEVKLVAEAGAETHIALPCVTKLI